MPQSSFHDKRKEEQVSLQEIELTFTAASRRTNVRVQPVTAENEVLTVALIPV